MHYWSPLLVDYQETAIHIGKQIKSKRKEKKLSQLDLASLCNMERSNLSRIESGKSNLTLQTMVSIATALEVEVRELL
jgi:transcriptional regulator with XRE-family HTH domain